VSSRRRLEATPGVVPLARPARFARALQQADTLPALERVVLELATAPSGAGCRSAWLMVWNGARSVLQGWQGAHATADGPAPADAAEERLLREYAVTPAELPPTLASVWTARERRGHVDTDSGFCFVRVSRGAEPYGMLAGVWDPGAARRPQALETLAAMAGEQLARIERTHTVRRRALHAARLARLARVCAGGHGVTDLLAEAARSAAEGTGARAAVIWRAAGERLVVCARHGNAAAERLAHSLETAARCALADGRRRVVDMAEPEVPLVAAVPQLSAVALVPLVTRGEARGVLAVSEPDPRHPGDPRGFEADALEFLDATGDVAALVLELAAHTDQLGRARERHADMERTLRRGERLAALGEHTTRFAREARHPLASIAAFARRVQRLLPDTHPERESLDIVVREAERLERLVAEPLEFAAAGPPRLRMESLNAVVQEALTQAGETLVRRRVRLLKRLDGDLPPLLLDPDRLRRATSQLLAHALDRVGVGGRVRVQTRQAAHHVVLEVAHDGTSEPGGLLQQVFAPVEVPGAGLGLALAQQIVREHGGELRARREGEWGAVLSLAFPVHGNQDRRGAADRRRARADRRGGYPG
jgi:signal transduction histidine kinase